MLKKSINKLLAKEYHSSTRTEALQHAIEIKEKLHTQSPVKEIKGYINMYYDSKLFRASY